MKFGIRLLFLSGTCFFWSSAEAMVTKVVNIDDVHKYSMRHHSVDGTNYVIEAGIFSDTVYAYQYKKHLSSKIHKSIRVEKYKNRYYVYVGPFYDIQTMVNVSKEISKKDGKDGSSFAMHKDFFSIVPDKKHENLKSRANKDQSLFASIQRILPIKAKPLVTNPRANYVTKISTNNKKPSLHNTQNSLVEVNYNSKKITGVWKDMEQNPSFKAGPYVGASIGPQFNIVGLPTTYDALEGTISAGWGHIWTNRLYLAGEIFGSDGKKLKSYPANGSGYTIQSNWSAGIDILPGYMIMDYVLGYLRLGWVQTDFNLAATPQGQASFAATSNKGGISNPRHVNLNAWQVGLGGEVNIYKNLDIRSEYIFSLYNSASFIQKPQVNQINIGLLYKFVDH